MLLSLAATNLDLREYEQSMVFFKELLEAEQRLNYPKEKVALSFYFPGTLLHIFLLSVDRD
jgi:hypothetical protein